MAKAIIICTEFSAAELRAKSRAEEDRRAAMRMLAIAKLLDGFKRAEAARLADMEAQALTDAIKRYDAEGITGLTDRERPGRPPKFGDAQREELRQIVLAGPAIEKDGLSAFTREDIARTTQRHREGIRRWFDSRIANGLIEGLNSLVQAAKAKARGYRTLRNLKAIVYLIAGKLDLRLPTRDSGEPEKSN